MPDENRETVISTLVSGGGSSSPAMRIAKMIAIAVPVVGALPTAYNAYQSYKHGIPFNEVSYRLAQHDLWVKNFDCKIDYRALTTTHGTRIDVGACSKTGDISIKVTAGGQASYEWLAFDKLKQPATARAASLSGWLVGTAEAQEPSRLPAGTFRVAQATMEVVCQTMTDRSKIVRIVKEAGKCYREHFSPFQGKVEKREEVPCNTQCPPAKQG